MLAMVEVVLMTDRRAYCVGTCLRQINLTLEIDYGFKRRDGHFIDGECTPITPVTKLHSLWGMPRQNSTIYTSYGYRDNREIMEFLNIWDAIGGRIVDWEVEKCRGNADGADER